jgi:hypothetical protein
MKTYKQIEQRVENEWLENKAMLYSDNPEIMVMSFIKENLKQAILDFYEEVVPEKDDDCTPLDNYDRGLIQGYNDLHEQILTNKETFFKD